MGDSSAMWPFEVAAALKILQQWGVELLEANFYPLSSEQADDYYAASGESEATGPWFGIHRWSFKERLMYVRKSLPDSLK